MVFCLPAASLLQSSREGAPSAKLTEEGIFVMYTNNQAGSSYHRFRRCRPPSSPGNLASRQTGLKEREKSTATDPAASFVHVRGSLRDQRERHKHAVRS